MVFRLELVTDDGGIEHIFWHGVGKRIEKHGTQIPTLLLCKGVGLLYGGAIESPLR